MKKIILLFITYHLSLITFAQNLVPNPSFEDTLNCPDYNSQINKADGWRSFRNTPDYFHNCSSYIYVSIPSNAWGFQYPTNNLCNAYAGIYTYGLTGANWREYIGRELSEPLIIGQKYFVTFKISLAENQSIATNNIGVLFSSVPFDISNPTPILNYAHINQTNIIADTINWVTISGSFITDSTYKYIIIGNFFRDTITNIDTFNINGTSGSYYFVDDICVSTDSLLCNTFSSICISDISDNSFENLVNIYPNPAKEKFSIILSQNLNDETANIKVYNMFSELIYEDKKPSQTNTINLSNYSEGIYLVFIQTVNKQFIRKLLLTK